MPPLPPLGLTSFSLKPLWKGEPPAHLHSLKNDIYLSAAGRMCGVGRAAMIDSRELAQRFADFLLPKLRKVYGEDMRVVVLECLTTENSRDARQMREDSEKIRQRLAN